MNRLLKHSLVALVIGLGVSAQAGLIINDSFNYNLGGSSDEDSGLNGGSGLPASSTATAVPSGIGTGLRGNGWDGSVVAGLSYPGLAVSGNGLQASDFAGFDTSVYRGITNDPWLAYRIGGVNNGNFGPDGTTLYFSFLMRTSATGEGTRSQVMITGNGGVNRLYFGVAPDATVLSIVDQNNSTHDTSVFADADTTYLVVVRIDFASGNDTVSMYVDPVPGAAEPETADAVKGNYDLVGGFQQIAFRTVGATLQVDEFRMGATWDDVTPVPVEPALIVYDDFDYTLGSVDPDADAGLNGGQGLPYTNIGGDPAGTGTGMRNNWQGVTVAPLSYSGLQAGGNALQPNVTNGFQTAVYRNMTVDPFADLRASANALGKDGTTLYFSWLMQTSAVGTGSRATLQITGDSGSTRVAIGLSQDSTFFDIQNGAGTRAISSVTASPNTTYLIVARIDYAAGDDTVKMWVNPAPGGVEGAPDAIMTGYDVAGGFLQTAFRYNSNTMLFDEFRAGKTWGDVTPTASLPPADAPAIAGVLSGGNMLISLQSQSGYDYTLQQSTTGLGSGDFSTVETKPGNGGTLQFTAPGPGSGKVFYRVEVNP